MLSGPMPHVVKLFNTYQKFYETLGFDIFESCCTKCLISAKSVFHLIASMQLFISTTAFFLFEAQTADEHGISFYISITILVTTVNISTVAWKMDEILMLIRNYEEFIDKSQFSLNCFDTSILQ